MLVPDARSSEVTDILRTAPAAQCHYKSGAVLVISREVSFSTRITRCMGNNIEKNYSALKRPSNERNCRNWFIFSRAYDTIQCNTFINSPNRVSSNEFIVVILQEK